MLTGGGGRNLMLGGVGANAITGGSGDDVVLGDNGIVNFTAGGVITARVGDRDRPGWRRYD